MKVRVSRRVIVGWLLGSVAGQALAEAPSASLRPVPRPDTASKRTAPTTQSLLAKAGLSGKISFVVADARSGKVLEAKNPVLPMPPASVTKTVTALYALDRLGADHRFRTRLVADGTISGGRLRGDLILVGGGDPTLDTDGLGEMARQLKAAGVREITGEFRVHSGPFPRIEAIDPGQPPHVSYNPAVSGLNLNFNRVHFEWKRQAGAYSVAMDARARRYRPQVAIARMRVVDRALPVYTYADSGGADQWTVARAALGKEGSRWLPVRKPELYAAEVFQTLARSQGIVLPQARLSARAPRGTTLVEQRSKPLREILREMLKYSTNLTAEVVGLAASAADGGAAQSLKASAAKMTAWARKTLGTRKAKFMDHSGLGRGTRINASEMAQVLVRAQRLTDLPGILKEIRIRNDRGEPVPDYPVKVRAKTGTLNFASALAGYMTAEDGRRLVFAIFSADLPRRASIEPGDGEMPKGSRDWLRRARRLQMQLIRRWGAAYSA